MKVGVTFGCYCPLHSGHYDLIMRAKKENDVAAIFVCGYDNDRRVGKAWIDLDKKIQIIKTFFANDPLIKVGVINDTKLGLDESFSLNNWKIWLKCLYDQLGDMGYRVHSESMSNDTITIYVGEPKYKDSIELATKELGYLADGDIRVVLVDRSENTISGTECRLHPQRYWNEIAEPFRPYFSHNILIAGTASEGKTTLVQDIGKRFGIPFSYEKGRDIYKFKANVTDRDFNFKDFMYNITEQRKLNEECISSPSNPGIFISDTDNMVTLMYAKAYSEREGFALSKADCELLEAVAAQYVSTTTWDKIFLLKPTVGTIMDDGERYMPDSDIKIRQYFYEILKGLYDKYGYEYEELEGNYWDKYKRVRDYIYEVKEA